jgi:hypothetical protein
MLFRIMLLDTGTASGRGIHARAAASALGGPASPSSRGKRRLWQDRSAYLDLLTQHLALCRGAN